MKSLWQRNTWATLLAGLTIGIISSVAWTVIADSDPSTDSVPRMIPYQGILEMNGEPVHTTGNDVIAIEFALFDADDEEATDPIYTQNIDVKVFAGRFTATIGPVGEDGTPLTQIISNADNLELGMTLLNSDENGEDIVMSNRQRILATPYAMWSTSSTNFTVANTLVVNGTTNTHSLNVTGPNITLGTEDGLGTGQQVQQRALAHHDSDQLALNPNGDFEGGVHIESDTTITGNLALTGNLAVEGAISGRIVGGATANCTGNSAQENPGGCSAWGAADCGGSACTDYTCNRGTLRRLGGVSRCYYRDWNAACHTMLCIEE